MFQSLTQKLSSVFDKLRGRGLLNEDDITQVLREIRVALLEADVAIPAVKDILERVKIKAQGKELIKSVTPGQMIVKFVHEELISFLGETVVPLNLKANSPFSFMFVGLQGSGKTTTTAKLANILKDKYKILLVSLDVYRPAAREQLELLGKSLGIESLDIVKDENPFEITKRAFDSAKRNGTDIILFDTAGRTNIDESMMNEVKELEKLINPIETLFVADSMSGQNAVNIAKSFNEFVNLTGIILTRVEGDSRGGAALSTRYITKCPIKFLGIGEKINDLLVFDPKRIADRILDMGDIVTLVEQASKVVNEQEVEKMQQRLSKGTFDLNDMKSNLEQVNKIGGFSKILQFIPGTITNLVRGSRKENKPDNNKIVSRNIALIQSMTEKERKNPALLNGSRRKRIAQGAGQTVTDLNKFLKQFEQLRNFTKKMSKMESEKEITRFLSSNNIRGSKF